ncbi:MAG: Rieske 2Fe-2S domain-containing protein [Desulfobacterales bacterium]|nr:Rieske 2Fe-2S domain-containing protein [Desulfobacterales bacterium]
MKKSDEKHELGKSGRRSFLNVIWGALGCAALLETAWVAASFFKPRKSGEGKKGEAPIVEAGAVERFAPGSVTAFPMGRFYLVRLEDGGFLALTRNCSHLGCAVPWVEKEKRFVCPCHASVFDITGRAIRGPASRALSRHPVFLENNVVKVDAATRLKPTEFGKAPVVFPNKDKG